MDVTGPGTQKLIAETLPWCLMIHKASRMESLTPFYFSTLNDKIRALQAEGGDVIRLDVGSPDLPPSEPIINTLGQSAAAPGHHGYQPHNAPQAYRQAWVDMYRRTFGVELDPDFEVLPLLGSKEGIFNIMQAFINPGDIVLIPDPGYPTYTRGALFAGGVPFYMPLSPERNFLPDLGSIPVETAQRAKILWINYPNNPTAGTAPLEFFTRAVNFALKHDLILCHDAAYTQVTYDGYQAPSILQVPGAKEVAVEFISLSKSHNMAGWRVGVVLGNPRIIRALYVLKTNLDSGHFLPVMEAAAVALTGDQSWLAERNQIYRQRRDIVIRGLHALGLQAHIPRASIYTWSTVPAGWSSMEFAANLLERASVSITPGTVFGANGEGYVRISLVAPNDRINEAMDRIAEWWRKKRSDPIAVVGSPAQDH